jgi:foldase protein PrsA
MRHVPPLALIRILAVPAAMAGLAGCAADAPPRPEAGLERSDRFVRAEIERDASRPGAVDRRPPAMVEGTAIPWADLRTPLAEAAGGVVLEEIALDSLLAREAAREGVEITPEDLARERRIILETFAAAGAGRDENERARTLDAVRRARGLGPQRFDALLRRNAILRALVQGQVQVTEASIQQMYALEYGQRRLARIITVDSLPDAQRVLDDLREGRTFGEVAALRSTDPSARRGGVIEPISPADPSYPAAVRTALTGLSPGQTSDPVAIEGGYAILRLDRVLSASEATLEELRPVLEERARRRQERIRMGALADRLLEQARVTVFDDALERAWRQHRQARQAEAGG